MDDGIAIDVVDTRHDALLELGLGGHPDVAQDRAGELGEEAFNKVEPRALFGVKVSSKRPTGRVASQALVSFDMCAE